MTTENIRNAALLLAVFSMVWGAVCGQAWSKWHWGVKIVNVVLTLAWITIVNMLLESLIK